MASMIYLDCEVTAVFKNFSWTVPETSQEIYKYIPGGDPHQKSTALQQFMDSHFTKYMICDNRDDHQKCVCSACHTEVVVPAHKKHGDVTICPNCGEEVEIIHLWRGCKKRWQGIVVTWFDRAADGESIIGRMFWADRMSSEDRGTAMEAGTTHSGLIAATLYKYRYGGIELVADRWDGYHWDGYIRKDVIDFGSRLTGYKRYASKDSLRVAARGTPFAWSLWDTMGCTWTGGTGAWKYLDFFAKYEAAEYLCKMKMKSVIRSYVGGYSYMGTAINWHGRTPNEIFKMHTTKEDRLYLHNHGKGISSRDIYLWTQISKVEPIRLQDVGTIVDGFRGTMPKNVFAYVSPKRAIRYLKKANGQVSDYDDYLGQAMSLGMDMKSKSVLFPRDLQQAHANLTRQINMKKNKLLEKAWEKRRPSRVKKYKFEQNGLRIVIPEAIADLITEGRQQNNCVGTYMSRVSEGKTDVVFIREINPDGTTSKQSYITMEINQDRIVQARTKNNNGLDSRGKDFVEKFRAARLEKKARKSA